MKSSPQINLRRVPDDHEQFPFARKHVPFLSFPSIVGNPDRLAKIVNADEFEQDLDEGKLPHYCFYVPNLINDGHSMSDTQDRIVGDDVDLGPDTPNVDNISKFLQNEKNKIPKLERLNPSKICPILYKLKKQKKNKKRKNEIK